MTQITLTYALPPQYVGSVIFQSSNSCSAAMIMNIAPTYIFLQLTLILLSGKYVACSIYNAFPHSSAFFFFSSEKD